MKTCAIRCNSREKIGPLHYFGTKMFLLSIRNPLNSITISLVMENLGMNKTVTLFES